jgi:hypothetical protein
LEHREHLYGANRSPIHAPEGGLWHGEDFSI